MPPQDSHTHYKEHWCNWETFFQLQIGLDMYKPCNWRLSRSKFMGPFGLSLQRCLTRFNVTWNIRQPGSSISLITVLSSRAENVLIQDRITKWMEICWYFKSCTQLYLLRWQNSFYSSDWIEFSQYVWWWRKNNTAISFFPLQFIFYIKTCEFSPDGLNSIGNNYSLLQLLICSCTF